MITVTMKELLEAGVQFGHQTSRWNPKMKPYIFGKKNGIYIINLEETLRLFHEALEFLENEVAKGKKVLIVGTKKQAQDIVEEEAKRCGAYYVNVRWLGGLLTNFHTIRKSVEKLIEFDEMKKDGRWDALSKKEQSRLEKRYRKLYKNLNGVRDMKEIPDILIVIDSENEKIAVHEAKKKELTVIGVVDTNGDPEALDYPIPGNDDALRSIKLFLSKFADAIIEGRKRYTESQIQPIEENKEENKEEATEEESTVN